MQSLIDLGLCGNMIIKQAANPVSKMVRYKCVFLIKPSKPGRFITQIYGQQPSQLARLVSQSQLTT